MCHACCLLQMWSACTAWLVHMLVVKLLMRAMSVPGIPWVDLAAYTGYAYVQGCIVVGLGYLAGGLWQEHMQACHSTLLPAASCSSPNGCC